MPHLMHSTAEAVFDSDLPCRAGEKPLFSLSKGCCVCCAPDVHTDVLSTTSTLVRDPTPPAIMNRLHILNGERGTALADEVCHMNLTSRWVPTIVQRVSWM